MISFGERKWWVRSKVLPFVAGPTIIVKIMIRCHRALLSINLFILALAAAAERSVSMGSSIDSRCQMRETLRKMFGHYSLRERAEELNSERFQCTPKDAMRIWSCPSLINSIAGSRGQIFISQERLESDYLFWSGIRLICHLSHSRPLSPPTPMNNHSGAAIVSLNFLKLFVLAFWCQTISPQQLRADDCIIKIFHINIYMLTVHNIMRPLSWCPLSFRTYWRFFRHFKRNRKWLIWWYNGSWWKIWRLVVKTISFAGLRPTNLKCRTQLIASGWCAVQSEFGDRRQ